MAASRRSAATSKPRRRPTAVSKPGAKRRVARSAPVVHPVLSAHSAHTDLITQPVLVAPDEPPTLETVSERLEQPTPAAAEPILLLGGHPNGPEVLVVDPEETAPHPPAAARISARTIRSLAWGASVALMVATIVGGLEVGYSLKTWVADTQDSKNTTHQAVDETQPEVGLTESAPPRRGAESAPATPKSRVDPTSRPAGRQPAALPPAPADAQGGSLWPRLTALMGEGIRLHREGWYGPATARFREAVTVMPDYLRAYLWLGRAGLKAGRYDEARRALEQVIALDPESTAAQEAKSLLLQIDKAN